MAKQTKQAARAGKAQAAPPSPLFDAIRARDVAKVRELLKSGAVDLTAKDPQGRTAFQAAMYHRSDEIAVMLIDAGAPLEADDLNLYWAVHTGRADVVRKFIDAGANVEMKAVGGKPLQLAASRNLPEIVQALIEAGSDINHESEFSGTPLASAVEQNSAAAALVLIRAGAKLDPGEYSDSTLLISAIGYGSREVALALIEAGADVNQRGKAHYLGKQLHRNRDLAAHPTPLILAARVGDAAVVEALLARGADLHARDEEGKTALDRARDGDHPNVVKRLEAAAKAKPAKANLDEDLIFAADEGDVAKARDLLSRGGKVDARDTRSASAGFTPLMLAARRGDAAMATLLLDAGAAVDARDNDGEPPDPTAIKKVKWMIEMGADDYIADLGIKLGRTPLHLGVEADKAAMVELLLKRGANPNAADVLNRTPAAISKDQGHKKVLELLKRAGGSERAPTQPSAPATSPPKARAKSKAKPDTKAKARKPAKKKKPGKAAPLPEPDFAAAANTPAYEKALAEMETICGSKRQPMHGRDGLFTFHVHSSKAKGIDLRKIHEDFFHRGFYAFSTDATSDTQLALAPTADKYALIAAFQTNGANYDLGPEEIARWLRELEEEVPFRLTGIGWDFLKGYFIAERPDPRDLAERMYEFCPDIVDQGAGSVDALAESLAESDDLFFWWD